jgi:hypothetical protein
MQFGKFFLMKSLLILGAAGFLTAVQAETIPDYGSITTEASAIERPGKIVWMDLVTSDVRAAAKFYRDIFNWQFKFSGNDSYAYATLNGKPVASIAAYDEDVESGEGLWIASISVEDVDAAARRVKNQGGSIIEAPEDLPGRGRYTVIKDPTGAVVMLLRASGGDPQSGGSVNGWLWAELWTDDVDAALRFYEKVAGYRSVTVKDGSGGVYQVMGRDQTPHASVIKTPLPDVEPIWLPYLRVENVDATAKEILKAGGSVIVPPQKDGLNDDVAIVADPTGGVFALQQKEAE